MSVPNSNLPEELRSLPWYVPNIGTKLGDKMRILLEDYGGIPRYQQQEHIHRIRDAAFRALPIGTIGEFWFLVLGLAEHPEYTRIVERLKLATHKSRSMLIYLGTCLGQDLRKLVYDGASPTQLVGIDKYPQFGEIGLQLFQDGTTFGDNFHTADIFGEDKSSILHKTKGTWDIVASAQLLHAFDWNKQKQVVRLMFELARGKGSWLVGLLAGDLQGHAVPVLPPLVPAGITVERYIHSAETLRTLFEESANEASLSINILIRYQEDPESLYATEIAQGFFTSEDARLLFYFVEILS